MGVMVSSVGFEPITARLKVSRSGANQDGRVSAQPSSFARCGVANTPAASIGRPLMFPTGIVFVAGMVRDGVQGEAQQREPVEGFQSPTPFKTPAE
jgi:hypothetical protein